VVNQKKIPITCPCSKKIPLKKIGNKYICKNFKCEHNKKINGFKTYLSKPIIISEIKTDTLFSQNSIKSKIDRSFEKYDKLKKIIIGESKITKKNCDIFIKKVFKLNNKPKILVIGGAQKGLGTNKLWDNNSLEIHSLDIYHTGNVDVICDCHYLCLKSNFYDGVWIQAVLEHVVEPRLVVKEINRVLKLNGIVYAETPFMQQVHEGAYDFNRFTVLGHRYLFRDFSLISIGGKDGPEVVFCWSLRYLIWSIFRTKSIAKFLSLIIGLVFKPLKLIINKKSLYDASSGVYFLGEKVKSNKLSHKDLIKLYKGQF